MPDDIADSTQTKDSNTHGSKTSVIAAILGNVGVAVVKFIASAVSGSSAMFSEAIHSIVDCGNGILILVGMKQSQRKPDFHHPFGSGKELYFYSLIVALMIFLLGGGVAIYEGINTIKDAMAGTYEFGDPLVAYIVIILAAIIEGSSLRVALKNFNRARGDVRPLAFIREAKDPSLYTVVLEDSAAELGLAFALIGTIIAQTTRNGVFDGGASVFIGLLLCCVSFLLLSETKGLLVGEGISADEVDEMRVVVTSDPRVLEVGRVLTMYMGPSHLIVAMDVTLASQLKVSDVDEATDGIEKRIRTRWPETSQVFVEVESLRNVIAQHEAQDEWDEEE